jgi:hypothetical protein
MRLMLNVKYPQLIAGNPVIYKKGAGNNIELFIYLKNKKASKPENKE